MRFVQLASVRRRNLIERVDRRVVVPWYQRDGTWYQILTMILKKGGTWYLYQFICINISSDTVVNSDQNWDYVVPIPAIWVDPSTKP